MLGNTFSRKWTWDSNYFIFFLRLDMLLYRDLIQKPKICKVVLGERLLKPCYHSFQFKARPTQHSLHNLIMCNNITRTFEETCMNPSYVQTFNKPKKKKKIDREGQPMIWSLEPQPTPRFYQTIPRASEMLALMSLYSPFFMLFLRVILVWRVSSFLKGLVKHKASER